MNAIVMPAHNNQHLTRKAIESFMAQTIPVWMFIIDDGSTDGTLPYLNSMQGERVVVLHNASPRGVTAAWNTALHYVFDVCGDAHALVCNNDIWLHPQTYHTLLMQPEPLVSGISVSHRAEVRMPPVITKSKHPDFSCFLLRRVAWERVGQFDAQFINYCSDGEMHIRMHRAGLDAVGLNVPFYHERSSTLKNADAASNRRFCEIADADRARFVAKYGFPMWGAEYDAAFAEPDSTISLIGAGE